MSSGDNRPTNASSRVIHERFIVSVDGQAKSSFANAEDAQKEADRIVTGYPKVVVNVLDGTRHLVREYPDKVVAEGASDSED